MDGTLAVILFFAGNFAPRSWAYCQGQLLAVASNSALFSLLGTIYGGDGRTTFALPDFRGRVPVGTGTGSGLSTRVLGQRSGTENNTLNTTQLPSHTHTLNISTGSGDTNSGSGAVLAMGTVPAQGISPASAANIYKATTPDTSLSSTAIGNQGGNQSVNNMQPWLGMNYVICLAGVYPSRN